MFALNSDIAKFRTTSTAVISFDNCDRSAFYVRLNMIALCVEGYVAHEVVIQTEVNFNLMILISTEAFCILINKVKNSKQTKNVNSNDHSFFSNFILLETNVMRAK
jgi:hypothetical protein